MADVNPVETPVVETPVAPVVEPAPVQTPTEPVETPEQRQSRLQRKIDVALSKQKEAEYRAQMAEQRANQLERSRQVQPEPNVRQEQMVGEVTASKWREWHDEDPLAANDYLLEIKANKKAQEIVSNFQAQSQHVNTVEEVYKAHPELREVMNGNKLPEEVPFWNVYDEVAREMPDARYLAKGPYIVMKEAERRIKERDMLDREKQAELLGATTEANRQTRVGAAHTLSPSSKPPVSTVKLGPDEEKIARKLGMSPEEYTANKKVK